MTETKTETETKKEYNKRYYQSKKGQETIKKYREENKDKEKQYFKIWKQSPEARQKLRDNCKRYYARKMEKLRELENKVKQLEALQQIPLESQTSV